MPEFDEATAVRWDAVVPAVAGATGTSGPDVHEIPMRWSEDTGGRDEIPAFAGMTGRRVRRSPG